MDRHSGESRARSEAFQSYPEVLPELFEKIVSKLEAAGMILPPGGWIVYPRENENELPSSLRSRLKDKHSGNPSFKEKIYMKTN